MNVMAIHDGHNAAATLSVTGVITAAQEERFTGLKNTMDFPLQSIRYCLRNAGIAPGDLDLVIFTTQTHDPQVYRIKRSTTFNVVDYYEQQHDYYFPLMMGKPEKEVRKNYFENRIDDNDLNYDFSYLNGDYDRASDQKIFSTRIRQVALAGLGIPVEKMMTLDHHTCHAYHAYYNSIRPSDPIALVVTCDCIGDGANVTLWKADHKGLTELYRSNLCMLGYIWRYVTLLLGMKGLEHEYKVMGLAGYTSPYEASPVQKLLETCLWRDGLEFRSSDALRKGHFFHIQKLLEGFRFDAVAGGLQSLTEGLLSQWVGEAVRRYGPANVYLSGGVFMNVKLNKEIYNIPELAYLFIPPSGADESLPLGACQWAIKNKQGIEPTPLNNIYMGPETSRDEVKRILGQPGITERYHVRTDWTAADVAQHLADGDITARCSGKMEFGQRALGNRSILADPRKTEVIQKINRTIKSRDWFMPFAPAILREDSPVYLKNPKDVPSPFMTLAFDTTPAGSEAISAALHPYDRTCRPQILGDENPGFRDIIEEFRKITGVGAVLNTSFNLHGKPIVCTAEDAIYTMERSKLDHLILEISCSAGKDNKEMDGIKSIQGRETELSQHFFGCKPSLIGEYAIIHTRDRLSEFRKWGKVIEKSSAVWMHSLIEIKDSRTVSFVVTGPGAAAVGDAVLLLGALGVKHILFVGTAGTLVEDVAIGDFLVVHKAGDGGGFPASIESGSAGMEKPPVFYYPDRETNERLFSGLRQLGLTTHKGAVFSIGSVFAEPPRLLAALKAGGFAAVEMETAAFLCAAAVSAVNAGAVLWLTDRPSNGLFIPPLPDEQEIKNKTWKQLPGIMVKLAEVL